MHMADALLSPEVGITMAAVSAGALAYSAIKMKKEDDFDEKKIPLMGVSGAFVFAAQMINFTIPGTGSSGHIAGGILLAALLGQFPGLLTLAAVLIIQCLFFADGGLLALGCNIFNIGVLSCLVAYPLVFKPLIKNYASKKRIFLASILACVAGLQLGAFSVVLETTISGVTDLPFSTFIIFMQPIHLAIGIVEGIVTAGVIIFIKETRPEILNSPLEHRSLKQVKTGKVIGILAAATALVGGIFSIFASTNPDGLEWSIGKTTNNSELSASGGIYDKAAGIIDKTAIMPDYQTASETATSSGMAGIIGTCIVIGIICLACVLLYIFKKKQRKETA